MAGLAGLLTCRPDHGSDWPLGITEKEVDGVDKVDEVVELVRKLIERTESPKPQKAWW
ncbi:hypothetical protein L873DRAFT_1822845 [Choiromyces venosus 120613-1]|uniref:Uncharacterized protein n=1 Tax=Choiromyces venosus 120613-1 TaxID=1336337 RepID=A0A3N4J6A9_9PEZI|nr:hypothetical protein L873DRAFT_1822845 [Choiromyces venosus 120613-1]